MKNVKSLFACAVLTLVLTGAVYADGQCYLPGETPTGPPCPSAPPVPGNPTTTTETHATAKSVDVVSLAEIALECLLLL